MPNISNFTEKQKEELLKLLWNYLRPETQLKNSRVFTGEGLLTKAGLIACLESIVFEDQK